MTIFAVCLFVTLYHYLGQIFCWVNDDDRLPLFVGALFIIKIALALALVLAIGYLGAELIEALSQ
jgi:hypothetical protein